MVASLNVNRHLLPMDDRWAPMTIVATQGHKGRAEAAAAASILEDERMVSGSKRSLTENKMSRFLQIGNKTVLYDDIGGFNTYVCSFCHF